MTTKEYLYSVSRAKARAERAVENLNEIRLLAGAVSGVSYDKERVQESHNPDRMTGLIASVIDAEDEVNAAVTEYKDLLATVTRQINALPVHLSQVLYDHYLLGCAYKECAIRAGVCFRTIMKRSSEAMDAFELKFGNEYAGMVA